MSCEADKNRELISYISFEEYQNEFNLNDVPELDGELEKFFDEYVDLTYGIQHNHQLFLNYLDSLYAICVEDGENALRERGFVKKFHDKVTVNRLTDNAVSAGCKLVQGSMRLFLNMEYRMNLVIRSPMIILDINGWLS